MMVYKIKICFEDPIYGFTPKTIEFPEGKEFKNFNEYFPEYDNKVTIEVISYNQLNYKIGRQLKNGDFLKYYESYDPIIIYKKSLNGEIMIMDHEYYTKYIQEKQTEYKKKKLKKILNKELKWKFIR